MLGGGRNGACSVHGAEAPTVGGAGPTGSRGVCSDRARVLLRRPAGPRGHMPRVPVLSTPAYFWVGQGEGGEGGSGGHVPQRA